MRLVCLSDTHGFHKSLKVPDGDILIHAGDFSMRAKTSHVVEFATWIKSLPHKHKIVVPGNHDMACETQEIWAREEFAPAIFLIHEYATVAGLQIFGSPYSSAISDPSDWCYDYPRYGERGRRLWRHIEPNRKLDILITHGPPHGIGDLVLNSHLGEDPNVGDVTLKRVVTEVNPKVHIFGHIHEGYGEYTIPTCDTKFYNVSVCTISYKPTNPIRVIDLT